jgi:hypothetical protein
LDHGDAGFLWVYRDIRKISSMQMMDETAEFDTATSAWLIAAGRFFSRREFYSPQRWIPTMFTSGARMRKALTN